MESNEMIAATKNRVNMVLQQFKILIEKDNFTISLNATNRQKNRDFLFEYDLVEPEKHKELLMSITLDECCGVENSRNPNYQDELVYVFCCPRNLIDHYGDDYEIEVYIKFHVMVTEQGEMAVVISIHEREFPMKYLFKKE